MIERSVAKRMGILDEVLPVGALLMAPDGIFITGVDFIMDRGVCHLLVWRVGRVKQQLNEQSDAWRPQWVANRPGRRNPSDQVLTSIGTKLAVSKTHLVRRSR